VYQKILFPGFAKGGVKKVKKDVRMGGEPNRDKI